MVARAGLRANRSTLARLRVSKLVSTPFRFASNSNRVIFAVPAVNVIKGALAVASARTLALVLTAIPLAGELLLISAKDACEPVEVGVTAVLLQLLILIAPAKSISAALVLITFFKFFMILIFNISHHRQKDCNHAFDFFYFPSRTGIKKGPSGPVSIILTVWD